MVVTSNIRGVCISQIKVAVSDGIIMGIDFIGGCDGQCKVLNTLLCGQTIAYAVDKLEGITCGKRDTSCANELAKLLRTCLK